MTNSLVGQTFENLKVIARNPAKGHNSKWDCECLLCGSITVVTRPNLRSGNTTDCGCQRIEKIKEAVTKHGEVDAPIYKRWSGMRSRVKDGNKLYLSRGITVCEEWDEYEAFRDWALDNGFQEHLELDRINNDEGYSPDNCRWITHEENCNNRSRSGKQFSVTNNLGESFASLAEAASSVGLSPSTISRAIKGRKLQAGRLWFKL